MSAEQKIVEHGKAVAEGHGGEHAIPELANIVDYVRSFFHKGMTDDVVGKGFWGINYGDLANIIFALLVVVILVAISWSVSRKLKKVPTGMQSLLELYVLGMKDYVSGIMGDKLGAAFTPFCGTIFIYILGMALLGLIPFAKSPIALNINVPLAIAICVFFLVQYHGIKQNGIKGYMKHLLGESSGILPLDLFLKPLFLVLHVIGEFVKPLSLTFRLFGNMTGEDVVIAALVLLTVGVPFIPIPLQVLFFPLSLIFVLIQALVFTSLSAAYLVLMSAHEEEHH